LNGLRPARRTQWRLSFPASSERWRQSQTLLARQVASWIGMIHSMKLDRLHRVIQIAMGWTDSHLHQFVLGRVFYGVPDREGDDFGTETLNETDRDLVFGARHVLDAARVYPRLSRP
jgi:hypothetical protein